MDKSKYYPKIRRYLVSKIGNYNDAEDIAQNVFLELYRKNGQADDLQNAEAYLFGIAKNLIAKYYLNKQRQPTTLSVATREEDCSVIKEKSRADYIRRRALKEILKKSLKQLPIRDYETIRLFLLDQCSMKETAERENIPVSVFYKRYQRALKILRKTSMDVLKKDSGSCE